MPAVFSATSAAVSVTTRTLIVSALKKLGVLAAGETPSDAEGLADALEDLQALIDQWNAQRSLIYNVNFSKYTLTPNKAPHTIGPGGDFNVPIRPVKLVAAAFILSSANGQDVDLPMEVRDDDWWAAQTLKQLTSNVVTNVFYSPDVPLGSLNFWPIPTVANSVRLETWAALSQAVDLNTVLVLPAGYWQALRTTLPIILAPSYGAQVPAALLQQQRQAMQAILDNNVVIPRITTAVGMDSGKASDEPDFNFLTGLKQ